jgi:hypothetical protein
MIPPQLKGDAAMLTLDEAREVIRQHNAGGNPGYARWASACAVVYETHMSKRHPRAMLHTYPIRSLDEAPNISGSEPIPYSEQWTGGGRRPGSPSGARLVQRLPGDASAYFIQALGDGSCGVFYMGKSDNVLDPGETTGDGRLRDMRQRDASWNRSKMQEIVAANKKLWGLT